MTLEQVVSTLLTRVNADAHATYVVMMRSDITRPRQDGGPHRVRVVGSAASPDRCDVAMTVTETGDLGTAEPSVRNVMLDLHREGALPVVQFEIPLHIGTAGFMWPSPDVWLVPITTQPAAGADLDLPFVDRASSLITRSLFSRAAGLCNSPNPAPSPTPQSACDQQPSRPCRSFVTPPQPG